MCLGSSHASRNGSPDHRRLIDAHDPERRDIGQGRQAFDQRLFEADGLRLPEGRTIGRNHNGLGGIWRSRPPQKGRQVSRRQVSGALEHGSREFAGRRQVVRGKEVRQGRGQFADGKQIEITRLEGRNSDVVMGLLTSFRGPTCGRRSCGWRERRRCATSP